MNVESSAWEVDLPTSQATSQPIDELRYGKLGVNVLRDGREHDIKEVHPEVRMTQTSDKGLRQKDLAQEAVLPLEAPSELSVKLIEIVHSLSDFLG